MKSHPAEYHEGKGMDNHMECIHCYIHDKLWMQGVSDAKTEYVVCLCIKCNPSVKHNQLSMNKDTSKHAWLHNKHGA